MMEQATWACVRSFSEIGQSDWLINDSGKVSRILC